MDPFSLVIAATTFAGMFGGGGDPSAGSGGMDVGAEKKSVGSNFLNFKKGADAFLGVTGKKKDKNPFSEAPERPKARSVSELTTPQRFQPLGDMRFITGAENADIQNAMRILSNSSNRDVIRLIPMDIVQPIKKQTRTIALASSELGNVGP